MSPRNRKQGKVPAPINVPKNSKSVIARFRDGKIVEMLGVEDGLSQMRQLGFRLVEPVKVTA